MKNVLMTIYFVAVICGMLLTNGCTSRTRVTVEHIQGVGQSGNQAATNMAAGKESGDYSKGTGTGVIQNDTLAGLVESMKRKPANTRK